jgi:hypothetical protein
LPYLLVLAGSLGDFFFLPMDRSVTLGPASGAPVAAAPAPGRVMRVSAVAPIGPGKKKKKPKKLPGSLQVQTVAEPEQRKRAKRSDKTTYKNAARAVEMTRSVAEGTGRAGLLRGLQFVRFI